MPITDKNRNLSESHSKSQNLSELNSDDGNSRKKGVLFSRTLDMVDLRMTKPPEALRPKRTHMDTEAMFSNEDSSNEERHSERPRRSTPERRRKEKQESLGIIDEETFKLSQRSKELFADLSPEARKRLHAMLLNFCGSDDGIFRDDINLHQFSVDCGEAVTNATVQELCSIQPSMTSLDLTDSEHITDVALWSIACHCTSMKRLVLAGCSQITNIGLRSISLRCADLTTLDFSNCSKLDDIGLSTIASGCWKVEFLILTYCKGITDTGVGRIARACHRLKVLNLHGCTSIGEFGDHALKDIGAFCSDVSILLNYHIVRNVISSNILK